MKTRSIAVEYFPSGYADPLADPWIMVLTVDELQWLPLSRRWRLSDLRTDTFRIMSVMFWLDRSDQRMAR
jgi:hypothetical protein